MVLFYSWNWLTMFQILPKAIAFLWIYSMLIYYSQSLLLSLCTKADVEAIILLCFQEKRKVKIIFWFFLVKTLNLYAEKELKKKKNNKKDKYWKTLISQISQMFWKLIKHLNKWLYCSSLCVVKMYKLKKTMLL